MIDSTVAVQTKGRGFSFQAFRNSSIAATKSGTLKKVPRRMHWVVSSPNQRSTRFSQLELVGTKCSTKRGCFFSQGLDRLGVSTIIIQDQVQGQGFGKLLVQTAQEPQELLVSMTLVTLADHLSLKKLQGRKERRGPVALVVVGLGAPTALF